MRSVPSQDHPQQPEAFYRAQLPILIDLVTSRFDLDEITAEDLAHEILLVSLVHPVPAEAREAWLRASLLYAAERRSPAR